MASMGKAGWAVAALIGMLLGPGESSAQSPAQRSIVLNGQHLNAPSIAALDALNCGQRVPNGRYWVNWGTRTWGYQGGPAQGRVHDCTRSANQTGARQSGSSRYIEDRIFERSGVSIIQNPVYR